MGKSLGVYQRILLLRSPAGSQRLPHSAQHTGTSWPLTRVCHAHFQRWGCSNFVAWAATMEALKQQWRHSRLDSICTWIGMHWEGIGHLLEEWAHTNLIGPHPPLSDSAKSAERKRLVVCWLQYHLGGFRGLAESTSWSHASGHMHTAVLAEHLQFPIWILYPGKTLCCPLIYCTHQLDSVPFVLPLLGFVVGAFHLHGLEGLGQVVALSKVLGPLSNVGLEQGWLLIMCQNPLEKGEHNGTKG